MNKLFLMLLLAVPAFAQSDLPDQGAIADLNGKTKIYIQADAENMKQILKAFKKADLTRVDRAEDAEMFMEYKTTHIENTNSTLIPSMLTGEMTVYFYRDKRKVIAWSDSKTSALKYPSISLAEKFLKAIKVDR